MFLRPIDLLLPVAFFAPLAAGLFFRHRALTGRDEIAARWFAFARRTQLLAAYTPLLWIGVFLTALRQPSLVRVLVGTGPFSELIAPALTLFLAPAGFLPAVLGLIRHDVARRLDTTDLGWKDAVASSAWTTAAFLVLPLAMGFGFYALTRGAMPIALLLITAGFLGALVCFLRARTGIRLEPHAVTSGPLRDRLFEIAARAGVKLRQIYVLPMKRVRLANAFAVNGQVVMVTDLLLTRLSRAEVDAVMAHEIAHLRRNDPVKLLFARLGLGLVPFLLVLPAGVGWAALVMFAGTLAANAISRRIERATDREALRLGADAGALVSGLARLARLSHVPLSWSRWTSGFVTHPSITERARLLAAAANLSDEEVTRRLAASGDAGDSYPLPAGMEHGGRLFSSKFKNGVVARFGLLLVFLVVLVPSALFAEIRLLGAAVPHLLQLALALVLAPATALLAMNFIAVQPLRRLRRPLAERLALGRDPESRGWTFTGVAPHAEPRVYEGFANWDVGWLRIGEDAIEFAGEEAAFTLAPGAITSITLVEGLPGWIRPRAVLVRWTDSRGQARALRLAPLDAEHLLAIRGRAAALASALESWRCQPHAVGTPACLAPELPSGEITCTHPRMLGRPRSLVSLAVVDGLAAALLCGLLGLPILGPGFAVLFGAPAVWTPGWLEVVGIALATQFFLMIPALRYREPASPARTAAPAPERRAAA